MAVPQNHSGGKGGEPQGNIMFLKGSNKIGRQGVVSGGRGNRDRHVPRPTGA